MSTRAVDVVKLPLDSDRATWHRFETHGSSAEARLANLRSLLPARTSKFWDDVAIVAIEWPSGAHRKVDTTLGAFMGMVVGNVPFGLRPWYFRPSEWRRACGLPGNAPKDAVARFVGTLPDSPVATVVWPQDACDAFCIAYACRAINEKAAA